MEKPTVEIVYFNCKDIITTSSDHDNGFIDGGDFVRSVKDFVERILASTEVPTEEFGV